MEPQLHRVQFTSPMKPNTPVHPPLTPKQSSENEYPNNPYDQPTEIYHQMHIIPPPTQQRKLFERKPLPEFLIWKLDKEFEKWHNAYEAYIGQQHHLGYILEAKFHAIYLQHGQNKYLTLGLANITRVSPNVKYISVEQFEIDLSYFYNTLKFAVIYKGQNCVTSERWTKDGIVVYKNLLTKFKYGGDIRT